MRRRNGPALLLELAHHRQGHSGIGRLMAAEKGHVQIGEVLSTPVKMHAIAMTGTHLNMPLKVTTGQQQCGVLLLTTPREDVHHFGSLWGTDYTAVRLDD